MLKLKTQIICEFIIIITCFFVIGLYIIGLIKSNVFFSNIILSTMQTILFLIIMILMIPCYLRDLKKIESNGNKRVERLDIKKIVWKITFIFFTTISCVSIIIYLTIYLLMIFFKINFSIYLISLTFIMTISITITLLIIIIIPYKKIKKINKK